MDKLTLAGIVFGLVAIVGGSVLKGSGVAALANPAAFTIVIIGTFAAIFVQTPLPLFKHGMGMAKWVLNPPAGDAQSLIEQIVEWSKIARKQGLLGLESVVENQQDPFIKKGLQMLVDGAEPDTIRGVLEVEMDTKEHLDTQGAKMFESLGIYAPTLGIIGAVMGLMSVMKNLADPSKLGPGIAAAFVATIYGVAAANMIFLPMANKLKGIIHGQSQIRNMLIDGLISIAEGDNPRNIEAKLQGYVH